MSTIITLPPIILPNYDERTIFLGGTGSGKTNLAMTMASHYDKFVYIDPQHNLTPKVPAVYLQSLDSWRWEWAFHRDVHIVFRPKPENVYPRMNAVRHYDELLYMLHRRGKPRNRKTGKFPNPFNIYIDEAYALGHGAHYPDWAQNIAVMDRQKGIGLWVSSQRPVNIPVPLRSECAWYYVFYLSKEDDVDEIASYGRPKKALKRLLLEDLKFDHSFVQISRRTNEFIHRPPIKS